MIDKTSLETLSGAVEDESSASRVVMQVIVAVTVVGLLALGGSYYFGLFDGADTLAGQRSVESQPVMPGRTSQVAETEANDVQRTLNASGYVVARRSATVSSNFTGRVHEVLVDEGMAVQRGQVLARLDTSLIEKEHRLSVAQLNVAMVVVNEAAIRHEAAEREFLRSQRIFEEGVGAQAEVERLADEVAFLRVAGERARAEAEVARRSVEIAQQRLDDTVIRAPYAAIVISRNAQEGEIVSPVSAGGGFTRTGICTLVDMESLEVEVDINESYIQQVHQAQPVEIRLKAFPDLVIAGHVLRVVPTADRHKATVKVRIALDERNPRVLPDMGADVAFLQARQIVE